MRWPWRFHHAGGSSPDPQMQVTRTPDDTDPCSSSQAKRSMRCERTGTRTSDRHLETCCYSATCSTTTRRRATGSRSDQPRIAEGLRDARTRNPAIFYAISAVSRLRFRLIQSKRIRRGLHLRSRATVRERLSACIRLGTGGSQPISVLRDVPVTQRGRMTPPPACRRSTPPRALVRLEAAAGESGPLAVHESGGRSGSGISVAVHRSTLGCLEWRDLARKLQNVGEDSSAGLLAGHLMGGPDPDHSVVLARSSACRHPAIALSIAAATSRTNASEGPSSSI